MLDRLSLARGPSHGDRELRQGVTTGGFYPTYHWSGFFDILNVWGEATFIVCFSSKDMILVL